MKTLLLLATDFFKTLGGLFYPRHCAGCGVALLQEQSLCHHCWNKAERLTSSCCQVCSYSLSINSESCRNCSDRKLHFVAGVSSFQYRGLVKQLIARFKYGGDQSLKHLMSELIEVALKDSRLQGIVFSAVVPVPLYYLRERERGFNQAFLLAQEVALRCEVPLCSLLKRVQPTSFQASSDRNERLKKCAGAFALKKDHALSGNYLLVDDVLTTGSTLDECAKMLLQAGACNVWAVTVARS